MSDLGAIALGLVLTLIGVLWAGADLYRRGLLPVTRRARLRDRVWRDE